MSILVHTLGYIEQKHPNKLYYNLLKIGQTIDSWHHPNCIFQCFPLWGKILHVSLVFYQHHLQQPLVYGRFLDLHAGLFLDLVFISQVHKLFYSFGIFREFYAHESWLLIHNILSLLLFYVYRSWILPCIQEKLTHHKCIYFRVIRANMLRDRHICISFHSTHFARYICK